MTTLSAVPLAVKSEAGPLPATGKTSLPEDVKATLDSLANDLGNESINQAEICAKYADKVLSLMPSVQEHVASEYSRLNSFCEARVAEVENALIGGAKKFLSEHNLANGQLDEEAKQLAAHWVQKEMEKGLVNLYREPQELPAIDWRQELLELQLPDPKSGQTI